MSSKNSESILGNHDWSKVREDFQKTAPYNFAVIDDFFNPSRAEEVRRAVLDDKSWQYKNWTSKELYNRNPKIEAIQELGRELKTHLGSVVEGLELVNHWAFLHQRNAGLETHSDNGEVTVNIWLTPNQFNLEPSTGGMVFFDVKRDPEMLIHEFNVVDWSEKYVSERTKGGTERVDYAFNRAVVFDSKTFHASDTMNFVASGADTYRLNMTLIFDRKEALNSRYKPYGLTAYDPYKSDSASNI
ncbi:hypothetical protein EBR25_13455 [bacterium]|nr:hypothetical protein [bacterium]